MADFQWVQVRIRTGPNSNPQDAMDRIDRMLGSLLVAGTYEVVGVEDGFSER